MHQYNPDEIFQFAIRIEENGEKLYKELAKKFADKKEVADLFLELAEQEVSHRHLFQDFLASFQSYESAENYPIEYFEFIRAYADDAVFSGTNVEKSMQKIGDIFSALDFCMKRELDSVTYYNELIHLVEESDQEKVQKIIAEEKKHFLDLYKRKKALLLEK